MRNRPFILCWIVISLVTLLALTACERPVPRDDVPDTTDSVEPTTPPIVIPTPIPTELPPPESSATLDAGAPSDVTPETQPPADQPTAEPPSDTTGDAATPETSTGGERTHTVQSGDTLSQIAETFGVTVEEIAAANNLTNIDSLALGQVLVIPAAGTVETAPPSQGDERTHVVKSGENLFRIGLAYGFTAEELASYNGIVDPARIEVGQIIRIPPDN